MFRVIIQHRIFKYIIAGGVGAMVTVGGLFILHGLLGLWYLGSSIFSFALAVVASFILQKYWTFDNNDSSKIKGQFSSYVVLALINLAANAYLMYVFVGMLKIYYLPSQILTSLIVAIWSFFIYRNFIFQTLRHAEN